MSNLVAKFHYKYKFAFQSKLVRHGSSKKCLGVNESKKKLVMQDCNQQNSNQHWLFENFDPSKISHDEPSK
jgi:polypeptide N-acetylgalactosaminyltransferase